MRRAVLPWVIVGSTMLGCPANEDPEATGPKFDDTGTTAGDDDDADDDDDDDDDDGASEQSASAEDDDDDGPTEESGDPDDGSGFLQQPDGGVLNTCDPGAQDCMKGEKCTAYVSTPGGETVDANKCVPLIGSKTFGEECERMEDNDDCDVGFFCMTDVSGHTGQGFCLEFCEVNQPCEFGGTCIGFNDGALPLCQNECDPLLQDCPQGQGCYRALELFVCAMPGPPEGEGNDGDPCATIQGCNPGLICLAGTDGCNADSGCCTPICDLTEPDTCVSAAEDCLQVLADPPPQWQNVGACAIPE
jgi:hypothetical protein